MLDNATCKACPLGWWPNKDLTGKTCIAGGETEEKNNNNTFTIIQQVCLYVILLSVLYIGRQTISCSSTNPRSGRHSSKFSKFSPLLPFL